ncbi:unnamed protein product [Brassica napus]|uniref:(rape) hypothetical protein n=1 Tax=Brassica napus TaxID=3708 RepID=A0A816P2J6_BRANA|nr:unnamed protein product [Brassica napus]
MFMSLFLGKSITQKSIVQSELCFRFHPSPFTFVRHMRFTGVRQRFTGVPQRGTKLQRSALETVILSPECVSASPECVREGNSFTGVRLCGHRSVVEYVEP